MTGTIFSLNTRSISCLLIIYKYYSLRRDVYQYWGSSSVVVKKLLICVKKQLGFYILFVFLNLILIISFKFDIIKKRHIVCFHPPRSVFENYYNIFTSRSTGQYDEHLRQSICVRLSYLYEKVVTRRVALRVVIYDIWFNFSFLLLIVGKRTCGWITLTRSDYNCPSLHCWSLDCHSRIGHRIIREKAFKGIHEDVEIIEISSALFNISDIHEALLAVQLKYADNTCASRDKCAPEYYSLLFI